MKSRTRIEVVLVVASVVAAGGWLTIKTVAARLSKGTPPAASRQTEQAPLVPTLIMTAPATKPSSALPETEEPKPAVAAVEPSPVPEVVQASMAPTVAAVPLQIAQAAPPTPSAPAASAAATAPAAAPAPTAAAAPTAPAAPSKEEGDLPQAKALLATGKKFEARALLTKLILASPEGPAREELHRTLDEINKELFFSKIPAPDSVNYLIQPGDALSKIAVAQGKDVYFAQVIMLINGIKDPRRIQAGRGLKIPQGAFSAIVQKSAHRMILLLNGHYIKEYSVATGAAASPTPEGTFIIDNNKMVNPDWFAADGTVHKFGDPLNILGTRWLGFKENEKGRGYGIHGTTEPDTVGKDASNGCIRMLNNEVEEIFGMLQPGDTVEIVK